MKAIILILVSTVFLSGILADYEGSSPSCEKCLKQIERGVEYLNKTSTAKEAKNFLKGFCSTLGFELRTSCIYGLEKYGPRVFMILIKLMNPQIICQGWGECANHAGFDYNMIQDIFEKSVSPGHS